MYDLMILGAGPAGYVAAERAGELGKSVLLVERDRLGGVCLNSGCIPTKSFLYSAKTYDHARHGAAFGVTAKDVVLDYAKVKARTEKVQETLRNGIAGLMKKSKVTVVSGSASIVSPRSIQVDNNVYEGNNILICPGSRPAMPPIPGLKDNPSVVTSDGILALSAMPDHLCIIGGGVIGIEFACFYAMAGKKVTVVEMLPQICGNAERDLSATIQKKLESRGVAIHLNAKVTKVEKSALFFADQAGKEHKVEADLILCAAGRVANIDGMGFEKIGLDFDRRAVKVNDRAETNVPGVYAAGDVTGRWQLAHFASRQATVAVNNMFGRPDICREDAVPGVVYTDPEMASVGLTEDQAKAKNIDYRAVKMPLGASGRFLAETDGDRGMLKAIIGKERGELLGMHIVGPYASEMIGAACVMIETELRAHDIQEIIFPHPTVGELMKDVMFM